MFAATLITSILLVPTSWTVDDNGPADFSSIDAAMPFVADGDVLLVEPGVYSGFTVVKSLTILGRIGAQKPVIGSPVEIAPIASCTLAGVVLSGLRVDHVAGRIAIDDCAIGGQQDAPAFEVSACSQVMVTRTQVTAGWQSAQIGARITASNVTFVSCTIKGGHGMDFTFPVPENGAFGLAVANGRVTLADCSVFGGAAGFNDSSVQGSSGGAISAINASTVVVRGVPTNQLGPGSASPFGTPGPGLAAGSNSTIVVSGVTVFGAKVASGGSSIVEPLVPEPFLRVAGSDVPGQDRQIQVFGPATEPALLFASLAPAILASPLTELHLWFDPSALIAVLPITTTGSGSPLTIPVTVPNPHAFAGASLELQAIFPNLPGTLKPLARQTTNGANLLVRF
jgi:hypothetical protein